MVEDEANFSSLVEAHGPLVWRVLCRMLGSDDGVADCFQETFLEFLRAAKRSQIDRPAGLLLRIADRRAVDRIRKVSAERKANRPLGGCETSTNPDPTALAMGNELAESLRTALATLPEEQAAVFVLTQLEQMPHDAVARMLGITPNHVGVLLFRARQSLQKRLGSPTDSTGADHGRRL